MSELSDRGVCRGVYQSKERARQLLLFEDMTFQHNISPTDIDLTIEYRDNTWVLCEVKHIEYYRRIKDKRDKGAIDGQRLLMERFVNDMIAAGKSAIAIYATHNIIDKSVDVRAKECDVKEIYSSFRPKWIDYSGTSNLNEIIESWIKKYGEKPKLSSSRWLLIDSVLPDRIWDSFETSQAAVNFVRSEDFRTLITSAMIPDWAEALQVNEDNATLEFLKRTKEPAKIILCKGAIRYYLWIGKALSSRVNEWVCCSEKHDPFIENTIATQPECDII